MRSHIRFPHTVVVAFGATIVLAACGGDDTAQTTSPPVAAAPSDEAAATAGGGPNPFGAIVECLRSEGLDVDEPRLDRPANPPGGGSLPPDLSIPEGGFPGGSIPEGGFPGGSVPEGGPGGGGFPGDGREDPTFIAGVLGLDANDAAVAAALDACGDQFDN